jgi:hypothetical protein
MQFCHNVAKIVRKLPIFLICRKKDRRWFLKAALIGSYGFRVSIILDNKLIYAFGPRLKGYADPVEPCLFSY